MAKKHKIPKDMTSTQVAYILGMTVVTIAKLVDNKDIKGKRMPTLPGGEKRGRIKITRKALVKFLKGAGTTPEEIYEIKFMSISEIAVIARVSYLTVRKWIAEGLLKSVQLGPRSILAKVSDVTEFLVANEYELKPIQKYTKKFKPGIQREFLKTSGK